MNSLRWLPTEKKIYAKIFINAAGVYGDVISRKAGIDAYTITARKGEYILLEPNEKYNVHHIIFPSPTKTSKGILVTKTITGYILLGPNAVDMPETEKSNNYTTREGLKEVLKKQKSLCQHYRRNWRSRHLPDCVLSRIPMTLFWKTMLYQLTLSLRLAQDFGVRNQLYNFTCYADLELGVDLGASWQNQLIQWIKGKGLGTSDILYRHSGSWQV